VYSWRQEDSEGYETLFASFSEANDGITVKFEPFNSTDYDQILRTAITSGDPLDVVQLRPYAAGRQIMDDGTLEDLSDLDGIDAFTEEALASCTGSDGVVYGVPLAKNALITLVNSDLLEENGVEPPTTWPDFLAACDTLASAGVTPIAQSGKDAYILGILYAAIAGAQLSDDFVDAAFEGSADFTDQVFQDIVQRVLDVVDYCPKDFVGMADDEARNMFAQGDCAFYINGDYRIAPLLEVNGDLNLDYLPTLPDSGDAFRLCNAIDGSYALAAESPDLEDAKKLLAYMTTTEFGTEFANIFGRLSAVEGTQPEDDIHQRLVEDIASSGARNLLQELGGGEPDIKSEFENALQGALTGQIDRSEIFTTTQSAYENRETAS
jgi:raffinose/stachyose/melibiose transport system substrate-binding protein